MVKGSDVKVGDVLWQVQGGRHYGGKYSAPRIASATVTKITAKFVFIDGGEWGCIADHGRDRITRRHEDALVRVYQTADAAWEAFKESQRKVIARAELDIENARKDLQVSQLAQDALRQLDAPQPVPFNYGNGR